MIRDYPLRDHSLRDTSLTYAPIRLRMPQNDARVHANDGGKHLTTKSCIGLESALSEVLTYVTLLRSTTVDRLAITSEISIYQHCQVPAPDRVLFR